MNMLCCFTGRADPCSTTSALDSETGSALSGDVYTTSASLERLWRQYDSHAPAPRDMLQSASQIYFINDITRLFSCHGND